MRNKKRIMVCVTQQKSCRRLIEEGNSLRRSAVDELHVVHVFKENWRYFGQMKESDALEYLFDAARDFGAELSVFRSSDIEGTLKEYVLKNKITSVVMGESQESTNQQNMILRLKSRGLEKVHWHIVSVENADNKDAG